MKTMLLPPLLLLVLVLLLVMGPVEAGLRNIARFPASTNRAQMKMHHRRGSTPGDLASLPPTPPYQTGWFDQYLDHFNFASQPQTWKQRYLINTDYWNGNYPGGCPGPIFFYTGNESPVTDYWDNSGFVTRYLAPKLNGMILMAEMRYFGESQPFGAESQQYGKINYLSPEQALEDYAYLLTTLKEQLMPAARNCPVVTFGGSFGGMLSTWFRAKYPHIVIGALAASAPFAFYGTGVNPYTFMDTCQATYAAAGAGCDSAIYNSFLAINQLSQSASGLQTVSEVFRTCAPLSNYQDGMALINWIENGLVAMAMLDYPYPTDYGVQFPGWPVNATCSAVIAHGNSSLLGIASGMQNYFNSTGTVKCLNITTAVPDWGGCCAWDYLACTEMFLSSSLAQRGMFWPETQFSLNASIAGCYDEFNVTLRPNHARIEFFGGFNLSAASNIIFSNGLLDPWHTSGLLESLSPTLTAIVIPESAHHLDLRAPNDNDPIYVTKARAVEEDIITQWIKNYFDQKMK